MCSEIDFNVEAELKLYRKMYATIVTAAEIAIEAETKEKSDNILKQVLLDCEEMYVGAGADLAEIIEFPASEDTK